MTGQGLRSCREQRGKQEQLRVGGLKPLLHGMQGGLGAGGWGAEAMAGLAGYRAADCAGKRVSGRGISAGEPLPITCLGSILSTEKINAEGI